MKKFNIKSFTMGLLIGCIIMASTTVFAKSESITAFFNNIKVLVNGKEIAMDTEPFIYNGRTYVQLKGVCDALNASVKWNETNNTVEINSKTTTNSSITGSTATNNTSQKSVLSSMVTNTNNISDQSKIDTKISSVVATSANTLDITFVSAVDKSLAENINSYKINKKYGDKASLSIISATLDSSSTKVTLTTDTQDNSTLYEIKTSNSNENFVGCKPVSQNNNQSTEDRKEIIRNKIKVVNTYMINEQKCVKYDDAVALYSGMSDSKYEIKPNGSQFSLYLKSNNNVINTFNCINDNGILYIDYYVWLNTIVGRHIFE
jgi:hypothetical protein